MGATLDKVCPVVVEELVKLRAVRPRGTRLAGRDPHYGGRYDLDRRRLVALCNATPAAVCWRDGLTLEQHRPHRTGKAAHWTAGHHPDGCRHTAVWLQVTRQPTATELHQAWWLLPEVSTCNYANGARRGNDRRANPQSRKWLA